MKSIFDRLSIKISELTTKTYSTSFSLGIKMLSKKFHNPIYSIYGFVRFADEIVDGFHDYNKSKLLNQFEKDCFESINEGVSMNPILNSFQKVVNEYKIDHKLIQQFLYSMKMDLDQENYERLSYYAKKLGSAFQKINFLRDISADYNQLGRTYFPGIDLENFKLAEKKEIEIDIKSDFQEGYTGIKMLPRESKLGVYLAYIYYFKLFEKIKSIEPEVLFKKRVRISNTSKFILMIKSLIKIKLNII
jgi:phytoene/squalene synthetase